jgi:hypothetical protein
MQCCLLRCVRTLLAPRQIRILMTGRRFWGKAEAHGRRLVMDDRHRTRGRFYDYVRAEF